LIVKVSPMFVSLINAIVLNPFGLGLDDNLLYHNDR